MIKGKITAHYQNLFWRKVVRTKTCWLWTAAKNEKGYGVFGIGKETDKAPRISWRLLKGPIPRGLFVLHKCDNPACVRIEHLFLGTNKENVDDMIAKGRNSKPPEMGGWNKKSIEFFLLPWLGKVADTKIANAAGVSKRVIQRLRNERGIPPFPCQTRFKKKSEVTLCQR